MMALVHLSVGWTGQFRKFVSAADLEGVASINSSLPTPAKTKFFATCSTIRLLVWHPRFLMNSAAPLSCRQPKCCIAEFLLRLSIVKRLAASKHTRQWTMLLFLSVDRTKVAEKDSSVILSGIQTVPLASRLAARHLTSAARPPQPMISTLAFLNLQAASDYSSSTCCTI